MRFIHLWLSIPILAAAETLIFLKQSEDTKDFLKAQWYRLSSPESEAYGKFWTDSELLAHTAAPVSVLNEFATFAPGCKGNKFLDVLICQDDAHLEIPDHLKAYVWTIQASWSHGPTSRQRLGHERRHIRGKTKVGDSRRIPAGPVVELITPNSTGISMDVNLVCSDGEVASALGKCNHTFCAQCKRGAGISEITLIALDGTVPVGQRTTSVSAEACAVDDYVTCTVDLLDLPPMALLNFELTAGFTDGSKASRKLSRPFATHPQLSMSDIKKHYRVPLDLRSSQRSSIGIAGFDAQGFDQSDLDTYLAANGLPSSSAHTIGPNTSIGYEATLDVQLALGMAAGSNATFLVREDESTLHWLVQLGQMSQVPLVNTISWGDTEDAYVSKYGIEYVEACNWEFIKLGLRGVTMLVADGDGGCHDSHGSPDACKQVRPLFPSSSPYVTTVSATRLFKPSMFAQKDQPLQYDDCSELAASVNTGVDWTTGGGFSNLFSRPTFQAARVSSYMDIVQPSTHFNRSGRGYPDMSALGHNMLIFRGGSWTQLGGSSASSPIVAGMMALVNDARLSLELPPLGPLSPLLYSLTTKDNVFQDVMHGDSFCTDLFGEAALILRQEGGYEPCCSEGLPTIQGWDAVSGNGRLDFSNFLEAALRAAARVRQADSAVIV